MVVENCLKRLYSLGRNYKYVGMPRPLSLQFTMTAYSCTVTCMITQNTGAGVHTSHTCYWDANTDGFGKSRWENGTMCCLTTVYALAI
mmetsp:Transcript_40627/g.105459  ORF Transcript_40627/g.105459 Transcript_40627/m.105459 type:complete len:88 (-) Transcript_40627:109-372(-)